MKKLKEKISKGEQIIGTHIALGNLVIADAFAQMGYDFIWVDTEHSGIDYAELLQCVTVIKAHGTPVIVRAHVEEPGHVKRILEMGVDGIVFPNLETAAQVDDAMRSTLYPPRGYRGFGPLGAVRYGLDDLNDYISKEDDLCRFVQIERKQAVDALDEILQNPYVDGYILGPCDLSASIGMLNQIYAEENIALVKECIAKVEAAGGYMGISLGTTKAEEQKYWMDLGVRMISAGADYRYAVQGALANCKQLKVLTQSAELYKNKVFSTGSNLTQDINCSLRPPCIFGKEAAEADCYSAKMRKWQSAPCVAKASNGDLYCTFSGDNYGGDEAPNNYNVVMRSRDDGKNWETVFIIDHMDSVRMHGPILWLDNDGILWCFWAQSYNWWDGRGGVWAMQIDTSGEEPAHSSPVRLCDGVLCTTPITLSDGRIMYPVSIWKRWRNQIHAYPNWGNSAVYVSEDKGKSVVYVGGADEKDSTFDENAIVQRADGSLFMIIRCTASISYSISEDLGKTWSVPQKLMDHTSSRSWLAKLPSGNYVLVTNDDTKNRSNMTAFLSTDECRTWSAKLLLDERDAVSYPCGCVDSDGRIFVTYDFNRYAEEEIYMATFTERDILEGKIVEDRSYLKQLVVKGMNGQSTDKTHVSGD